MLRKIAPLALIASLSACGGEISPDDVGGAGGTTDVGGAGGAGGENCIENNPGIGEIVNGKKENYPVHADSCEDFKKPFVGKTSCEISYSWESETVGDFTEGELCCYRALVSRSFVGYEAIVYTPQWADCNPCWDEMLEGFLTHQQGHVKICKGVSENLWDSLRKAATDLVCDYDCEIAERNAPKVLEEEIDVLKTDAENKLVTLLNTYDYRTNYGETQGAWLDCNCNE